MRCSRNSSREPFGRRQGRAGRRLAQASLSRGGGPQGARLAGDARRPRSGGRQASVSSVFAVHLHSGDWEVIWSDHETQDRPRRVRGDGSHDRRRPAGEVRVGQAPVLGSRGRRSGQAGHSLRGGDDGGSRQSIAASSLLRGLCCSTWTARRSGDGSRRALSETENLRAAATGCAGTVVLETDSLSIGEHCGNARFAEWTSCSNPPRLMSRSPRKADHWHATGCSELFAARHRRRNEACFLPMLMLRALRWREVVLVFTDAPCRGIGTPGWNTF